MAMKEVSRRKVITEKVWVDADKPKKKNYGKIFEKNFFDSFQQFPKYVDGVFAKREKDSGTFNKGDVNGFDFQVATQDGFTCFFELKTHLDGFIPKGAITEGQLKFLNQYSSFGNFITGFIFNFRDQEGNPTYFVDGETIYKAIYEDNLSGFNIFYCECNGIPINHTIKKVHPRFHVHELLNTLVQIKKNQQSIERIEVSV